MKCIKKIHENLFPKYPIDKICEPEKTLFIDIETTGLYAKGSNLYLIGCVYKDLTQNCWATIQWFAENYNEEEAVLRAFVDFSSSYSYLIHFNGNTFDIPFLKQKIEQYRISYSLDRFTGIDIYRRIFPFKHFLKLTDCKQKTIEGFVHSERVDTYTGGELIDVYHDYVLTKDEQKEHFLLLHNEEDIIGMLEIIASLAVSDLITEGVKVTKVHASYYNDIKNEKTPELIITVKLPSTLPSEISYGANGCYFIGSGEEGKLRVPLFEEEMKYFYKNYKEYYYLPKEDMAIHKSVANFVDKEYREQANARNCYTRKKSTYLQQWDEEFTPVFKRSYDDADLFLEMTDDFKTEREYFNKYVAHILKMLISQK